MDFFYGGLGPLAFWAACGITLFGGFVKGAIGFALPLIMISAFGSFMPPETALAGLILATFTTNIHQALRHGLPAAREAIMAYRRLIGTMVVFIVISAQFVPWLPQGVMLALLGLPTLLFALAQLGGKVLRLRLEHRQRAEYGFGTIAGLYGGISGVWSPPLIVFLLSVGADKREMVRVQGVVYLIGAGVLMLAHLQSGVLNAVTLPFSAALILPAALGMWLGFRLQDRLDPGRFRFWTLVLLCLTALNLLRRAFVV
ncbi:MAG: sulfite exporter TauE/SafE family protein [Gemmobacter sp.]